MKFLFAQVVVLFVLTAEDVRSFQPTSAGRRTPTLVQSLSSPEDAQIKHDSRRQFLTLIGSSTAMAALFPAVAKADVSSGDTLPPGMQQFSKALRLRSDIKKVKKRVAENAAEIDKAEWENIGRFLRTAYSTGDDMKLLAGSIGSPENKKRALDDIDQLRKYAQAGDVSVTKQDAESFLAIVDKMGGLVQDFFDALRDVPDEI